MYFFMYRHTTFSVNNECRGHNRARRCPGESGTRKRSGLYPARAVARFRRSQCRPQNRVRPGALRLPQDLTAAGFALTGGVAFAGGVRASAGECPAICLPAVVQANAGTTSEAPGLAPCPGGRPPP